MVLMRLRRGSRVSTLRTEPTAADRMLRRPWFLGRSPVLCRERDVERYGRTVAACLVRNKDIGRWLVKSGQTFAYRRYSSDDIGAEQGAKNNRCGMWAGHTQAPWEWRKEQRYFAR